MYGGRLPRLHATTDSMVAPSENKKCRKAGLAASIFNRQHGGFG